MVEIEVPFTNQEVDSGDDPTMIVMTILTVIAGFAVFAWAQDVGGYVATRANDLLANLLGTDPTTGEDADDGLGVL